MTTESDPDRCSGCCNPLWDCKCEQGYTFVETTEWGTMPVEFHDGGLRPCADFVETARAQGIRLPDEIRAAHCRTVREWSDALVQLRSAATPKHPALVCQNCDTVKPEHSSSGRCQRCGYQKFELVEVV